MAVDQQGLPAVVVSNSRADGLPLFFGIAFTVSIFADDDGEVMSFACGHIGYLLIPIKYERLIQPDDIIR